MAALNPRQIAILSFALAVGLTTAQNGWARDDQPLGASATVDRPSDPSPQDDSARNARTAQLLQLVTAIDSYQARAGQLGLTLGQNFSVKRLAVSLRDDHNRLAGPLKAAMQGTTPATAPAPVLQQDLSSRLSALFQLDNLDFDGVFVASEIKTDQQALDALDALGAYKGGDLDPAARSALQLLTDTLQRRLDQAQTLQRQLG